MELVVCKQEGKVKEISLKREWKSLKNTFPDIGWRIDIRPATKVLRVEEGRENDDDTEIVVKEKGKRKAASKRVPAKRKHYGRKKVLPSY